MRPRAILLASLAVLTLGTGVLSGCAPKQEYQTLMRKLQQKNLYVAPRTSYASFPFFSMKGTEILVEENQPVAVFEYPNSVSMRTDASGIAKDGRASFVPTWKWGAPPHFFATESSIILYPGKNDKILKALREIYGPPFAEGK